MGETVQERTDEIAMGLRMLARFGSDPRFRANMTEAADLLDTLIKERDEARAWSPEMKAAAMADAQKVCEQHAALTKLKSERDALLAALKPFAEYFDWAKKYEWPAPVAACNATPVLGGGGYDTEAPRCEITVGDLRKARDIRNAIEAAEGK